MPSSVVQFRDNERQTVLVVEPDLLVRAPLTEYLRHCGYRVFEAVNAHEASLVLDHAKFRVDVVLSAVEMPGSMNGFQLLHWVRLRHPETEVILAGTVHRAADAEQLRDVEDRRQACLQSADEEPGLSRLARLKAQRH